MTEEQGISKFEYLKEHPEELKLQQGEQMAHCIDADFNNGSLYEPNWIVTNHGRVYSLPKEIWLTPSAMGTGQSYWGLKGTTIGSIMIHKLVCYYFQDESDSIALKEFEKDNLQVHHQIPITVPEELKTGTKANEKERKAHCMKCTCKSNLWYQEKTVDHVNAHRITDGKKTIGEEQGTAEWDNSLSLFRTLSNNSATREGNSNGSRIIYSYDDNGNLVRNIKMVWNLKGTQEIS